MSEKQKKNTTVIYWISLSHSFSSKIKGMYHMRKCPIGLISRHSGMRLHSIWFHVSYLMLSPSIYLDDTNTLARRASQPS